MAGELKDFGLVKDVIAINGGNNVTIRFTDSYRHEVEFNIGKDDLLAILQIETQPVAPANENSETREG